MFAQQVSDLVKYQVPSYLVSVLIFLHISKSRICNHFDYFKAQNWDPMQDYARLHGYEFVLGTQQVDPKLENMWNKLGAPLLSQLHLLCVA